MSSRPSSLTVVSTAAIACSRSVTSASIASAADLGRERVEPVLAAGGDGDLRALRRQRARGRLADAAARARDERDGAFQCQARMFYLRSVTALSFALARLAGLKVAFTVDRCRAPA